MPEIKVDAVVNLAGTGKPNFPVSPTHSSGSALSTLNTYSYTSSGTEPSSPKNGAIWWDSSNNKVMVYINSEFKEISLNSDYPSAGIAWGGDRSVTHTGYISDATNTLEYHSIGTAGNAQDFGDLTLARYQTSACSSGTRGVYIGGSLGAPNYTDQNTMDYVAISTTGNATDFGDTLLAVERTASTSDGTRGVIGGGNSGGYINTIQYITIASAGNATDFGDLTQTMGWGSAMNDATRSIINKGQSTSATASMEYVTTQTTGNATDFGDHANNRQHGAASDATRGIIMGGDGGSRVNTISYVTIQTTGNTTDFGDLTVVGSRIGCAGDGTYATAVGGRDRSNTIDRVTVQTAGNATDHGDMAAAGQYNASAAGAAS